MLQKLSVSYKCCSFELSINQKILKESSISTKILSNTSVFNIDNQHIRIISEGSCDRNNLHVKIFLKRKAISYCDNNFSVFLIKPIQPW